MGLNVGIINIEFIPRPRGHVYEFAQHIASIGAHDSYMSGEGQSYIPFTQRRLLQMLDLFSQRRALTPQEQQEIHAWLKSLPWLERWRDSLPPDEEDGENDDYPTAADHDPERDGGFIELYFGW